MDIISRAMKKNLHKCEWIDAETQKWKFFVERVRGRQLFLFGIGEGMNYFLRNYGNRMQISGVLDNNTGIQGERLKVCCEAAGQSGDGDLIINHPCVLENFSQQDVVVLITSMNYYQIIERQMRDMGIRHVFVLLMMEADSREFDSDRATEDLDEMRRLYIDWCCSQKLEEKKVIMMIGVYGGHARQITRALLKERMDLDIVWVVENMHMDKPEGVRLVYGRNWESYAYEMETAKIWIYDDIISPQIKKRDAQIYIQVKHWSSITLKKFYLDDKSPVLTAEVEEAIRYDGARMDYLFSGSKFDEETCKSGFMFRGKAIRLGSARSDILFDKDIQNTVKERLGIGEAAGICLYVPTYRLGELEQTNSMEIMLDMERLLHVLKKKWKKEWYLLVRLHPSLSFGENSLPENNDIINVGDYQDSQELVAVSDIMITDYSSIMFEEAYRKKPVFLYAPDRKAYISRERGLLIDYDTLPFPVAESNEQLHRLIEDFDIEKYIENLDFFMEKYGVHEDGHASERAAKFVMGLLEGQGSKK